MNINSNIALFLPGEDSVSMLKTQVFKEELMEVNTRFPLGENEIDIRQTYFIKNEDNIELGFFIRNGLRTNLSIEELPLDIQDSKGNIILSKKFNFKDYGIIPPYSARPYSVCFEIDENINIDDEMEYTIKFNTANNFNTFSSVLTEIENLPIDLTFEEEKEIKDFANALATLKADEFTITAYKISYNKNDGLDCILLVRNGNKNSANLERLPISIIYDNNVIIAHKIFGSEGEKVEINAMKSKLVKYEFKSFEVPSEKYDLSKCKVIFQ